MRRWIAVVNSLLIAGTAVVVVSKVRSYHTLACCDDLPQVGIAILVACEFRNGLYALHCNGTLLCSYDIIALGFLLLLRWKRTKKS